MSSNVGLSTPRGSGTSGYVQRNLSHLRPRETPYPTPTDPESLQKYRQRKPDKEILDHDRLREIEVQVFNLQDKLEDEGVDDEGIQVQTEKLRKDLTARLGRGKKEVKMGRLKNHQVHEMAAQKIEESDKLRRALGISKQYEEGSHWRRGEERLRESLEDGGDGDGARSEQVGEKER